ncbi:MAG: VCBS repeat-containing protein [Sandaracinaceae bacterium]|nr:VCBS repeat-containing protein [Sandaracinaceae bacterium]
MDHKPTTGLGVVPGANGVALADLDQDGDPDVIITGCRLGPPPRVPEPLAAAMGGRPRWRGAAGGVGAALRSGFGVGLRTSTATGWWTSSSPSGWARLACGRSHARLYQNTGAGGIAFTDVTERAGVTLERADNPFAWSFGAGFTDFDEDGWPDLLVTSDARTSRLFFGGPGGEFTDPTRTSGGPRSSTGWAPPWPTSTATGGWTCS